MQTSEQKQFHILNLGAGVQSTALYLMFMRGELTPQIDAAIFADTQDEPKAVYRHLGGRVSRGITVHQYIGISLDEAGRARRIQDADRPKYFTVKFPLIENFMTRPNCITYLADKVPHETPRSACKECPFHDDHEWDRMRREDPESFAEAVQIDRALRIPGNVVNRNMDQQLFLHRSCVPLEFVQLDTRTNPRAAQLSMNFSAECMGVCGV